MVAMRLTETALDPTSARARAAIGGLTVPPSAPVSTALAMMVSSQPKCYDTDLATGLHCNSLALGFFTLHICLARA